MSIEEMTTSDNFIYESTGGNMFAIGNDIKKTWIKLPNELGGNQSNIIDSFQINCVCGKHTTTLYVLQDAYMTMNCIDPKIAWMWLKKPADLSKLDNKRIT